MKLHLRLVIAHAALFCGCLGTSPSDAPSATVDDSLERRYFNALCASGATCAVGYGGVSTMHAYGYTSAQCVESFVPAFSQTVRSFAAGVRLGKLRFDESVFARCLERVSTTCVEEGEAFVIPTPDVPFVRLCQRAFTGLVPVGGACAMHAECVEGTHCAIGDGGSCARTCQPLPTDVTQRSCASDSECPPPADEDAWSQCVARRCVTVRRGQEASMGQNCGVPPSASGVVTMAPCAPGLYCRIDGLCRRLKALGEACEYGDRCEIGSVCFGSNAMSGVGHCVTLRLVSSVGGACVTAPYQCAQHERLVCLVDRCVAMGEGASCTAPQTICQGGTYCDRSAGVCARQRAPGARCAASNECLSGVCERGACAAQGCDPRL